MKKPQWIVVGIGIVLVTLLFFFGKTIPEKKPVLSGQNNAQTTNQQVSIDSILTLAKKQLSKEQVLRLSMLENSISRGDVKDQKIKILHQLAHFWADSAGVFEPYAWYEAEAARLENSEKSLTFAAQLFLDNLQTDEVQERRRWKALQAKDLFERSLKINPANDSAQIGLGACYIFGGISAMPMEGILKVKAIADQDSTNIYALMTLAKGSVMSGQYDKAISRLESVNRIQAGNTEAILMLADVYERTGDKKNAIAWYQKSLQYVNRPDVKAEVEKRIDELKK
ncbi:MAG TPA: tetratricopeptide repeat protein [Chitinophagaceae bacterium]|nr:tetratricopeptide repeat protein [Chitinophagaceae bacterium]